MPSNSDSIPAWKIGDAIGRGHFGTVYRALDLMTGEILAIKSVKVKSMKDKRIDDAELEAELLKTLDHPNIVKYIGLIRTSGSVCIVLEYIENGSLAKTLKTFESFPEYLVAEYCLQILQGLAYLHSQQVVHCDLKAANILTTKQGKVKLSDFGVSLNLHLKGDTSGLVTGTPNWMAPEVITLQGASTKSDIWSLGCTVVELCTGKPPYDGIEPLSVMYRVVQDEYPPLPLSLSAELRDFLHLCFRKDPEERPSARTLLFHPWITRNYVKEWAK
ncbi:kinase-like domain-containing protein [Dichotomocladium elegans]|nr:kinase-like domain-containing protein [Dichotomocladium elegans]